MRQKLRSLALLLLLRVGQAIISSSSVRSLDYRWQKILVRFLRSFFKNFDSGSLPLFFLPHVGFTAMMQETNKMHWLLPDTLLPAEAINRTFHRRILNDYGE